MKTRIIHFCFLLVPVCAFLGCSNPADDVPEATIGEQEITQNTSELQGTLYTFLPGSTIEFTGSKITGSHNGGFKSFAGEFQVVDGDPEKAQGTIAIDMNSTWSDNNRLTGHLKSPDFFDVQKYPESVFTLAKITQVEKGYTVAGTLDLHGVTKSISFPAEIQVSPQEITLKAEFFIKRFDFNIEYPGKADDLIRDEVVIRLDLKAKPKE